MSLLFKYLSPFFVFIFLLGGCHNKNTNYKAQIKDFEILCDTADLNKIYTNYQENIYIPIRFVKNNDTVKAKMRIRGDSSRKYGKKSLKIVFKKGEIPEGESKKINLNSEWTDKTYLRQYLSSVLMNKAGVICFESYFAKVKLNGKYWGLYLQVENMDKYFLERNYLDKMGNLYKATKDGACLSHFDDLEKKWEKKSNKKGDWSDLQLLINELDTILHQDYKIFLQQHFEYDRLISLIAMNMLLQNGSTYYHNYYMYHDINGTGKWQVFPWDMDKTLSYYNWKPYKYHETSSNWESDNPLIEKALLCDEVKQDIIHRIKELGKSVFNKKVIYPYIDSYKKALKDAIRDDETDQIDHVNNWKKSLKKEKKFIENQVDYILNQIQISPLSFEVSNVRGPSKRNVILNWNSSHSEKDISYKLLYGKHVTLEKDDTKAIDHIKDTFIYMTDLKPGKYYWRVYATDGVNTVEGFNTKNVFEIEKESKKYILKDTVFKASNSPHYINETLIIKKGTKLTVEKGSVVLLGEFAKIMNYGTIEALGEVNHSVSLAPDKYFWDKLVCVGKASQLNLKYCTIYDGFLQTRDGHINLSNCTFLLRKKPLLLNGARASFIWTHGGKINLDSCCFENKNISDGEGLNINFSEASITNSIFIQMADAIEYMNVTNGKIMNNIICNSPDDAIDLNGCTNIKIENNIILNNNDKAISVGTEQYGPSTKIQIANNIIIGNSCGVSVKDSSECIISNTSFIKNKLAVDAHLKNNVKQYEIGGKAFVTKSIFYENTSNTKSDDQSEIIITNSVSNKHELEGKGNELTKILFEDEEKMNYNSSNKYGAQIDNSILIKAQSLKQ